MSKAHPTENRLARRARGHALFIRGSLGRAQAGLPSVTLARRGRARRVVIRKVGRWQGWWCTGCSGDHGGDFCRMACPEALVAGRAGMGAVDARPARPGLDTVLNQQARQAGRSDLGSDANTVVYGLVAVSAATVGTVLAGRWPRHPVGWLLLAVGLWFVYGYASWVLLAWQGRQPPLASRSWTPTSW